MNCSIGQGASELQSVSVAIADQGSSDQRSSRRRTDTRVHHPVPIARWLTRPGFSHLNACCVQLCSQVVLCAHLQAPELWPHGGRQTRLLFEDLQLSTPLGAFGE
jgi:hypothetical protein